MLWQLFKNYRTALLKTCLELEHRWPCQWTSHLSKDLAVSSNAGMMFWVTQQPSSPSLPECSSTLFWMLAVHRLQSWCWSCLGCSCSKDTSSCQCGKDSWQSWKRWHTFMVLPLHKHGIISNMRTRNNTSSHAISEPQFSKVEDTFGLYNIFSIAPRLCSS